MLGIVVLWKLSSRMEMDSCSCSSMIFYSIYIFKNLLKIKYFSFGLFISSVSKYNSVEFSELLCLIKPVLTFLSFLPHYINWSNLCRRSIYEYSFTKLLLFFQDLNLCIYRHFRHIFSYMPISGELIFSFLESQIFTGCHLFYIINTY